MKKYIVIACSAGLILTLVIVAIFLKRTQPVEVFPEESESSVQVSVQFDTPIDTTPALVDDVYATHEGELFEVEMNARMKKAIQTLIDGNGAYGATMSDFESLVWTCNSLGNATADLTIDGVDYRIVIYSEDDSAYMYKLLR